LGIAPSYPATGFGYIHQGEELFKINNSTCYLSKGFKEKPDIETATAFLLSGEYTWNSGMFIWKASQALAEFERQQPDMYKQFAKLAPTVDTHEFESTLEEIWGNVKKISIDFAVMEHAEKVAVIPIEIGWNDVGSWASLYEVLKLDKFGNGFKGEHPDPVILDSKNTLVYSDKLTVAIGVEDLIIVETSDALLICHKDRAQDVKKVVDHLLTTKNYKYL
jgi:mannose-1-phosphate guanylyltransferase